MQLQELLWEHSHSWFGDTEVRDAELEESGQLLMAFSNLNDSIRCLLGLLICRSLDECPGKAC